MPPSPVRLTGTLAGNPTALMGSHFNSREKTKRVNAMSPLLEVGSPLDPRARTVVESVHRAELEKAATLPTDDERDEKRRHRVEWTRTEMLAQPEAIAKTLDAERDAIREHASDLAGQGFRRIYLVGCGDSLAVMVGIRTLWERLVGVPCEPIQALDFAYYDSHLAGSDSLVVLLSSSGETARTVEAALVAAAKGATTLGVTNTAGSTLMRETQRSLLVHATRRGWPTQASTAAMALLAMLALEWARAIGNGQLADSLERELLELPMTVERVLHKVDDAVAALAIPYADRSLFLYAGGGPTYACAMFGAAKMKECTPSHAIAIPLEEYHHYNSQKPGDLLFLVAPAGATVHRALDTLRQGRRVGGAVCVVTTEGESRLDGGDAVFKLPASSPFLAPISYTIPSQLFAYHVAMEKFRLADSRD